MASNFKQPGDTLSVTAPANVTRGQGILIGAALFGIVLHDASSGAPVEIATTGVWEVAKTSALAISAGDRLYWDSTSKVVNKTSTSQVEVGVAVAGAANPSDTVLMKLGVQTGPGTSPG